MSPQPAPAAEPADATPAERIARLEAERDELARALRLALPSCEGHRRLADRLRRALAACGLP